MEYPINTRMEYPRSILIYFIICFLRITDRVTFVIDISTNDIILVNKVILINYCLSN